MAGLPKRIVGFDIFDTLLTRSVTPPQAVFHWLGQLNQNKHKLDVSPEFFAIQRQQAELRSMQNLGHAAKFVDIYNELASALHLDEALRDTLMREELELEKRVTYAVESGKKLLDAARQQGHKIIFVSDMYLPEVQLRELLAFHGLITAADTLYVSCEYGSSKSSGDFFPQVIAKEAVHPSQITFYGNNYQSDVAAARRAGIEAYHQPLANENKYETILGSYFQKTQGISSKFAGASRFARLAVDSHSEHEAAIKEVAAGVAAPMLTSFVIWFLNKALHLGLERLYFLSRDGQVLLDIAERVKPKLGITIECRYLYASRLAWNGYTRHEKAQDWIWNDIEASTTLDNMLSRVSAGCLSFQDVSEELRQHGFSDNDLQQPMTEEAHQRFKACWNSAAFKEKLQRGLQKNKQLLDAYLEQEQLFDEVAKGIVDIGWFGTLHESLSDILEMKSAPPVHGFFYGTKKYQTKWQMWRHAFHFDGNRHTGPLNPLSDNGLFIAAEVFSAATHGTVHGFEQREQGIAPRLESGWYPHAEAWGFPLYRQTVMAFCDGLSLSPADAKHIAVLRPAVDEAIQAFWSTPSFAEARTWGAYPWDAGQGRETTTLPLASPIALGQISKYFFGRVLTVKNTRTSWLEGSIRITPLPLRLTIKGVNLSHRVLRKLGVILKIIDP